ncbi:tetratricopeptide repeat protein [Brevundimonas sp.]|uniref:tetratricopeptide repeat protein n=1 Tax=Brevundimonas sp. TaxID=1871086 RepID=UPI003D0C66AF
MTTVQSRALPPPSNWQDFERLTFDLFSRFWKTSDAAFNGRSGQPQAGVDVYGTDRTENRFTGVQCKGKDGDYGVTLKAKELLSEVEKAKTFTPPLEVFILATTAPDDAALQALARQITQLHRATGLFEVRVEGWAILKQRLTDYADVIQSHFPDLAPVAIGDQIASTEKRLSSDIGAVIQGQSNLERLMTSLLERTPEPVPGDPLNDQISLLGTLINAGDAGVALKALTKLEADKAATATSRHRYRMRAMIGSALLNLGRHEEAAKAFSEAYDFDPDWPGAMAIGATGALIEGHREEAYALADRALSLDPKSGQAASVMIDAAPAEISASALAARFSPDLLSQLDLQVSLSLRATKLKDAAQALKHAQRAFEIDPEDWRSLSALAETLLPPILSAVDVAISHRVPPEHQKDFDAALTYLEKAWDLLRGRSDAQRGTHIAANLVSALDVGGREEEALAVLEEGLEVDPTYAPLLRRQAQAFVAEDDWNAVRTTLAKVPADEMSDTDRLLDAQASTHLGQPQDGLERAQAVYESTSLDRIRDLAASMQIDAAVRLGGGAGIEVATRLMDAHPDAVVVRSVTVNFIDPKEPIAQRALAEIKALAPSLTDPRDVFHAAEALHSANEFSAAADLFIRVTATDKDTLPLRRLVASLHNAGRRREARELFDSLPRALQTLPRYAEMGSLIYDRSGLLPKAKALLEAAIAADPNDLPTRLAWMQTAERLGAAEEVLEWLKTVSSDLRGSPEHLMQIANAMDRLGAPEQVLPIAYRALRAGYNDSRIHTAYIIGLFLIGQVGRRDFSAPLTSGPNVAITLEEIDGDRRLSYVFETEEEPRIERQEIGPDNELWSRLAHLGVGDQVELPNLGSAPSVFKVTGLMSKYLYAYNRSKDAFSTLFPSDRTFAQFTFDPDKGLANFEPFMDASRDRAELGKDVEDYYRSGSVPLALFAKFANRSGFEIWEAVRQHPDLILMTCVGTEDELAEAVERLERSIMAVVDPITLYGLVRMGVAETVLGGFREVGLVQGALDLLRGLIEDRKDAVASKGGSLHAIGDGFTLIETTKDWASERLVEAEAALSYAETLTIVPSEPQRALEGEAQALFDNLPPAYADTIYAAQTPGRVLLCDDRALRLVAEGSAGVEGVWSQAVVASRAAREEIDVAAVSQAALAFLNATSTFTMVSGAVVGWVLDDADWTVNDGVRTLIAHTLQPGSDQPSAISLWSEVLEQGWFVRDEKAFAAIVGEMIRAYLTQQPTQSPEQFLNAVLGQLAGRLNARAPLRLSVLRDTTSLTSLWELRKPGRMAATQIVFEVGEVLEGLLRSARSFEQETKPEA